MIVRDWFPKLLIALYALSATIGYADAPRQLAWDDLIPKLTAADNPFAKFTKQQLLALTDIASVRDRQASGDKTLSAIDLEDERAATRRLRESGIDVDGLLAKRKQFAEQKQARARTLNSSLDGQLVRMPGYLLPLEFADKRVTEFLLVPWVGACVHTPPPPPNQIVYVKADKPFEFLGLFTPVQVTGKMSAAPTQKSLFLIDGASDINIGYSLRASAVEAYRE